MLIKFSSRDQDESIFELRNVSENKHPMKALQSKEVLYNLSLVHTVARCNRTCVIVY